MLSKRLQTVLDFIEPNAKLADIGCDHGYLALHAIYKGVKYVQLVDNKKGPLDVARNNLSKENLDATIEYSLSDGLSSLNQDINVVAICGMGGDLISKILSDNIDKTKHLDYLILEANSKVDVLRYFLINNGFNILDEEIVCDKNKYYQIIKTKYVNENIKLTDNEIEFGPILLSKKSEVFIEYIKELILKLELIQKKNNNISTQINDKIYKLKEVLNETN